MDIQAKIAIRNICRQEEESTATLNRNTVEEADANNMIDRICISINNRCNLACKYCHFYEKQEFIQKDEMDVFKILDHAMRYIDERGIKLLKIGFVGNGEPLLDYPLLKMYIEYISDYLMSEKIAAYSITNGLLADKEKLEFFRNYNTTLQHFE